MNRNAVRTILVAVIALAGLIAGCSDDTSSPQTLVENQILSVDEIKASLDDFPVGEPGEAEIADLLFMREEEKLAHDVYTVLYEQYGLTTFTKISDSEQKHADSIKLLLDRYGLEDPVGDNEIGVFSDESLATLYTDLIASGEQSLTEAILVGLAIEEIDILDLEEAMAQTGLPDVLMVYGNLLSGSHNHLRAYARAYDSQTGETYAPRWLSQEAYDQILSEESGRGRRDR